MRTFMLFVIGLTFGAAGGFVYAAANGFTLDGHDHSDPAYHGSTDHAEAHDTPLDLALTDVPTLAIEVTRDPMSGYNLHVKVDGFAFAPAAASTSHINGQGHAHVYVNGVKLARLYSPWMHLDVLPAGNVEIAVTLNTNDHRPLATSGAPITAKTTIVIE